MEFEPALKGILKNPKKPKDSFRRTHKDITKCLWSGIKAKHIAFSCLSPLLVDLERFSDLFLSTPF